ncbi:MAG TPA: PIG-L family deacetylase [Phycisphaerae bacterium]|nr:PIG-L family deacetylase [Phycisphaerae bacterium]
MSASDRLDIVFTAPHPDDLEISCGGTIAKLVKLGYRVGMVHMTNGEPTPLGDPETRIREMNAAAEILGVQACEMVGLTNRVLMDGPEARFALASVIRKYRPRVLVGIAGRTVAASPDHYQSQLITEATRFYSQLTKWNDRFSDTEPHAIEHLIYRPLIRAAELQHFPAQFVVDVTDTMEQKIAAVACYRSQFPPVRFEQLRHYIVSLAGYEGGLSGYHFGELYVLPRPIGTRDPLQLLEKWPVPSPIEPPRL